ncbi:MAG TPA: sugar porter family MFS transporter [Edaphobacter sp.]|uniref:sugar porter family MFS transporter n=1 Tax=Edaphobacter sp. TaxID=1934404 RepID=UPI002B56686D|nr:sugar porter family MFS transporter [Edaphobacter sp.]HUZ96402.1 sugar porter family MFS transporter [Edaphobacter sp.]
MQPANTVLTYNAAKVPLNRMVVASAMTASLGGLLFGFDTAVIAGVTRALTTRFTLTPTSLGFTVAIALWGTIVGAAGGGYAGNRFGRRDSLRVLALLFIVSALGCAFAWDWVSFLAFRCIAGIAIGASSVLGPMYIAEIAPAQWRGRMVGSFQLNIVFGILVAYFSNYVIGTFNLGPTEWRWKLGVSAVPGLLFLVMLFRIPRSPRWLVDKGRIREAECALNQIAGAAATSELAAIEESLASDRRAGSQPLFSRRYRIPVMLAIMIALFNQFSGINPILYYLNDIFARAGFTKVSGDLQAVAIGATNLIFTVVAMCIIDKVGRKKLLIVGSVGTFISLALISILFLTGKHQNLLLWPLGSFVAFFAVSQGSVIWVYISEIFPNSVRAKGQSLGSFTHWLTCATLATFFPVVAVHTAAAPFIFFSSMMVLQLIVVIWLFPETKGFTLEELQYRLETR